jgi:hypothetical protein
LFSFKQFFFTLLGLDDYLTHYWPICKSEMNDYVGSAHMTQGNLTTFTFDRFGNEKSALALNGGWTKVPAGIYFDTPEFTISVWIMSQDAGPWARLIDFGNGPGPNNILFTLNDANNNDYPYVGIESVNIISSKSLIPHEWQHLASTFDGHTLKIYIDGSLVASQVTGSFLALSSLDRTQNYVGKSNWIENGYSYSFIDDLRFYNKSLTQSQIIELMFANDDDNIIACRSTSTTTSTTMESSTTTSTTKTSG